ncbi:MAG: glycoside hydrolase family 3 protein [Deltaproteobacteria bacterium]|nr:MAG: glycoside hydrolase family 3 protein [Deltaproteobacteria bacterium]
MAASQSPGVLGKHFLIGLRPTIELHPDDRRLLSTLRPAGVIVYRGNFAADVPYEVWHAKFAALVAEIREVIGRDHVLVCVDHEGGTVLRPPRPITPYSFARDWADRAQDVGRAMGRELASLGINVNFAPVVDIASNPANPVIGPRAFAGDADAVIAAARPFIAAMQSEGVLACPKHFPGHGDTSIDSHLGLPVVEADRAALAARELRPFGAVARDVHLIMTAHIMYPAIDPGVPATMSRVLVDDVLRRELGYTGAIVTDDIGMRAVSTMFDTPGTCTRVISSGTDLIMICSHWTNNDRAYGLAAELDAARAQGVLSEATLAASDARIDALLAAAPSHAPLLLDPGVFAAHARLARLHAARGAAGQTVSLEEA